MPVHPIESQDRFTPRWFGHSWSTVVAATAAMIVATAFRQPANAQNAPMNHWPAETAAKSAQRHAELSALVEQALTANPTIRAAENGRTAARARIGPAGAWADPVLGVGLTDLPISHPGFYDSFTQKTVRVTQTIPISGVPAARGRVEAREATAADYRVQVARLEVTQQVKDAYYDLAFVDKALTIARQNHDVLVELEKAATAHYGAGTGTQQEALKAGIEAARLADEAVALTEQRLAALARLNALLDRPSETPVESPTVPAAITRAAVPDSVGEVLFVSPALGAAAANSPLPPLADLEDAAVSQSPMLQEHNEMISADAERVQLARKERIPDIDFSLEYDQRNRFPDFVSAMVSLPIPIHSGRKQGQMVAEARWQLAADEAQHHATANDIRATVASQYADVERARTQLALYARAILPQARASLASSTAGYQGGRADFATMLLAQANVFEYETDYYRALTDYAKGLAQLDRTVGKEVLP